MRSTRMSYVLTDSFPETLEQSVVYVSRRHGLAAHLCACGCGFEVSVEIGRGRWRADVAYRVGYSSASTFSVAFTRYVGLPPARYARNANGSQT